jgi:hypothetical protein
MYKKSQFNTSKIRMAVLIIVVVNMTLGLGILIGQRNNYNNNTIGTLVTKTETGLVKNILSDIKEKTIQGLGPKAVDVGKIKYVQDNNIINYELIISANYTQIIYGEDKKNIPTKLNIETMTTNLDATDAIYEKIGELELKKVGNNLSVKFYGSFEVKSLQVKQIVLKASNKEEAQNIYLYNDKELPDKVNKTPMPYFWAIL